MVATMVATGRPGVVSGGLARDLSLLERIADAEAAGEPGLGVLALSELVDREKSQVSRALGRLAAAGLVERDAETRRYRLGWAVFSLASRVADGRLLSAAGPPMRSLSAAIGETVHLCVLSGDELLTIRSETAGHGYRAGWIGSRVAVHNTSAGRALLMDVSPAELERRFAGASFTAGGPRARVNDVTSLVDAVAEARGLGYAIVDEEFEAGVAGVSAPIRDFSGAIVAALNVSAPADRLRPRLAEAAELTRDAAESVSRDLGWSGPMAVRVHGPS